MQSKRSAVRREAWAAGTMIDHGFRFPVGGLFVCRFWIQADLRVARSFIVTFKSLLLYSIRDIYIYTN